MTVCYSCTIKDEDLYIADDTMTLHWSFRQEMQCSGFNLSRMTTNTEIEIYDHILSRLLVQSLLQFKCVCKNWNDLIKTSSFIEKHFNSESNRLRLMITKLVSTTTNTRV